LLTLTFSLKLSLSVCLFPFLVFHSLLFLLSLCSLTRRKRADREASGQGKAAEKVGEVEEEQRDRN
jgi:hypothetical protein